MTPEELDMHAKRIAHEIAYSAIEDAADDRIYEVIGSDEELPDMIPHERVRIEGLIYDYMMDLRVSL